MIRALSLTAIERQLDATLVNGDAHFTSLTIDSRQLQAGDLFVAIKGPSFDGHAFVEQVRAAGAVAAVVEHKVESDLPQLVVENSRDALGQLGGINRDNYHGAMLAITGSAGKTTVKEMSAAILSQMGNTLATMGNFNNELGAPLTLMRLADEHQYAVLELGASSIGEIAYTAALVKPDVAVITNAAEAHIEGFGCLNNVVQAKGEILDALPEQGVAVINGDDLNAYKWKARAGARKQRVFSLDENSGADFYARDLKRQASGAYSFELVAPQGEVVINLNQLGQHNITNALAAAAATSEMGASLNDIKAGLETVTAVAGRLISTTLSNGARIIDDSYNANPESLRAAIDVLSQCEGHKVLVLGDMGELGDSALHDHQEAARYALSQGIDHLMTLGSLSAHAAREFGPQGHAYEDHESLIETLRKRINGNTTVLVKGSRSAHMERVVQAFTDGEH
ncbi:MAG: UDP-N-acetylmuramoyl-tripeptide--D-alanyl-D-alanine ligase [Pseudomonadales bacterium]